MAHAVGSMLFFWRVNWGIRAMLVELRVTHDGDEALVYTFKEPREAAEMIEFLSDFWPKAQFIVQPVRH